MTIALLNVSYRAQQILSLGIAMLALNLVFRGAAAQEIVVKPEQRLLGAGSPLVIHAVAENMHVDGLLSEWRERRADLGLTDLALKAQVWIAQHPKGILIAAKARSSADLSWQIRLASMPSLQLPPLGWLRANNSLERLKDCDALPHASEYRRNCPAWFLQQADYRAQLASMFVRNFTVDSRGIKQTQDAPLFSGAAFDEFRPLLLSLAGNLSANRDAEFELKTDGQAYELLIPWDALPATNQLDFKQLYMQIDLCISGQLTKGCLPLTQGSKRAANDTLRLILAVPRQYRLSLCNQKLLEDFRFPYTDPAEQATRKTSYFLPAAGLMVDSSVTFRNPGGGYLDGPDPSRISPEITSTNFANTFFGENEAVCTPKLSYLLNGEIISPKIFFQDDTGQVEHDYFFENFTIAGLIQLDMDRTLFVQSLVFKPSESGEGVNGACDRGEFSLWIANREKKKFTRALILDGYGSDLCAGTELVSAELSRDLQTVNSVRLDQVASEEQRLEWGLNPATSGTVEIAERYCLAKTTDRYQACGRTVRELTD